MRTDRTTSPYNLAPFRRAERRAHRRHRPTWPATCLIGPDGACQRGRVLNLSERGLAAVVGGRLEVGAVVPVRLFNEQAVACLGANLRVVRLVALPGGEYTVAGELDRTLTPAELRPFLL